MFILIMERWKIKLEMAEMFHGLSRSDYPISKVRIAPIKSSNENNVIKLIRIKSVIRLIYGEVPNVKYT